MEAEPPKQYDRVTDIPTDILASRFVGSLILAKGNLNKYQSITAHLIRELRGEPHPYDLEQPQDKTNGTDTE